MSTNSLDKFGELFAEEQPLWVKTLVPGQVSFEIQVAAGMTMPIRVPANGDPVCLTDVADFQSLKRCTDLRKLASPRETRDNKTGQRGLKPPAIKILTEAEMRAHLEQKATRRGWFKEDGTPDIERAMQPQYTEGAMPAPATRVELPPSQTKELSESQGADANLGQDGQVVMAEVIHPRVLAICNEISDPNLPENQRISADQILDEFETLGSMNPESLNHILAYGYYKSVKKWAAEQLKEMAE